MTAVLNDFTDGFSFSDYPASSTVGPFTLLGGKYALIVHDDTGTADVTLSSNTPSGIYVTVNAITVNGMTVYDLPPGQYEITIGAGPTAVDGALIKIPYRSA